MGLFHFQTTKVLNGIGPPPAALGDFGDVYFEYTNLIPRTLRAIWGPKDTDGRAGWGVGQLINQATSIVSIEGVSSPGGNVDVVPQNSITVIGDDAANTLTIGESHSSQENNPHKTTAAQVGAVATVASVAALKLLSPAGEHRVLLSGYRSSGDGGGGEFRADTTDTTTPEDGGTVFIAANNARWKRSVTGDVSAAWFGFQTGTANSATNKTALQRAMDYANAQVHGATVTLPTGQFHCDGGLVQGSKVVLRGAGIASTEIVHATNDVFVTSLAPNLYHRRGWRAFKLTGNSGLTARGIVFGNTYGARLDVEVAGYTNGVGIEARNTDSAEGWTEGTDFSGVVLNTNLTNLLFTRVSATGGRESFSDTRIFDAYIRCNIPNSRGIVFGKGTYLYASHVECKIHMQAAGGVGIEFEPGNDNGATVWGGYAIAEDTRWNVGFETVSGSGTTVKLAAGTKMVGHGAIYQDDVLGYATPSLGANSTYRIAAPDADRLGGVSQEAFGGHSVRIWGPAADTYRKIATLPASTADTFDRLQVTLTGGSAGGQGIVDTVTLTNRGGFSFLYERGGNLTTSARSNVSVLAYTQTSGAVDVYLRGKAGTFTATLVEARAIGIGGKSAAVPLGAETTTVPTGTVAFDSSTAAPNMRRTLSGDHGHIIAPKPSTDSATTYPDGFTTFPATNLAGYPTTNGTVHTTRISNDLTFQIFSNRLNTDRYIRWWDTALNTGAGGWTSFTALGGTGGSVSQATETALGGAEIADATEGSGGTNHTTIMTPLRVAERVNTRVSVSSPILETFIEGLGLWWDSGTGVSVSSGAAWIQSLGRVVNVPSALTLSALTLTASSWYYLYLFESAGVAAIEAVTTGTTAPTKGTARAKNGDLTRRFLGTLRVGAAGTILRFEHHLDSGTYRYVESGIAVGVTSPYRLISGGTATANTNVSCATLVPPTSTEMLANILTNGTSSVFFGVPGVAGDHTWTNVNNPGTQSWMELDATQTLRYRNGASGGSTFLDIYGYREGR